MLIIDDTSFPKQGRHSVGVARQYCGALGKAANCQVLVSLTLARDDIPVPIALRLYLPPEWVQDGLRCTNVGVPVERQEARTKGQIALDELDRVRSSGVTFKIVLADAGYGNSAAFRQALSERGLRWAVGIQGSTQLYPTNVQLHPAPVPRQGRRPKHPAISVHAKTARQLLEELPDDAWETLSWRHGTKGPLQATFAFLRLRAADGTRVRDRVYLPGE